MTVWSDGADDGGARRLDRGQRGAQVVVAVADVQPEVVHPDPAPRRDRRGVGADLNEQQLVVGAT